MCLFIGRRKTEETFTHGLFFWNKGMKSQSWTSTNSELKIWTISVSQAHCTFKAWNPHNSNQMELWFSCNLAKAFKNIIWKENSKSFLNMTHMLSLLEESLRPNTPLRPRIAGIVRRTRGAGIETRSKDVTSWTREWFI